MSVRGLSDGWAHRYGHPLYLSETFVDLPWAAWDSPRAMPTGRIAIIVTGRSREFTSIPCTTIFDQVISVPDIRIDLLSNLA